MRVPLIAASALVLLHTFAAAQQPTSTGPASLEGTVVRAGTNEPLAGARVLLNVAAATSRAATSGALLANVAAVSGDAAIVASTPSTADSAAAIEPITTDWGGKFVFRNLPPGLYRLQVYRDGYARRMYGQRTAGGPGVAIRLSAGQAMQNIVMTMIPASNVSGVIRGPDGQPQTGVSVQLLRPVFDANGQRTLESAGAAVTNDRGEYRLYWITPGRYYISGGTAPGPNRPLNPNAAASPNEVPGPSYSLAYYPGVTDGSAAIAIDVSPGVDLNGIDFTVARQRLYRVRGRVIDSATGQPPPAAAVSLAYRKLTGETGAFSSRQKYNAATGEFELQDVPAGYYLLQAAGTDVRSATNSEALLTIAAIASRPNARVPIAVSNADVNGMVLMLSSPTPVSGRLIVDGGLLSSTELSLIRVWLRSPANGDFGTYLYARPTSAQAPGADGSFSMSGISPGAYLLDRVVNLPTGFYVREAKFDHKDVLNEPVQVTGDHVGELEIVLSRRTGQLEGVALDVQSRAARNAQVALVPAQRNRTDLYRTLLTDANGAFRFGSVPPGDYRVFAWDALDSYAYFDQDLLRRLESQSVPVHISDSTKTNVTVRTTPAQ